VLEYNLLKAPPTTPVSAFLDEIFDALQMSKTTTKFEERLAKTGLIDNSVYHDNEAVDTLSLRNEHFDHRLDTTDTQRLLTDEEINGLYKR
jgi:hypothetical protein